MKLFKSDLIALAQINKESICATYDWTDEYYDKTIIRAFKYIKICNSKVWLWTGMCRSGYGNIRVKCGKNFRNLQVHRLMYELFVAPISNELFACHIELDDLRNNVCPWNITAQTAAWNNSDKARKGRASSMEGERHPMCKLSNNLIAAIIQKDREGNYTFTDLAKEFGVSRHMISNIVHGKNWTHLDEVTPNQPRRYQRKLCQEDALEIIRLKNTGVYTNKQLAIKYNVNPSYISMIINGKRWSNLK